MRKLSLLAAAGLIVVPMTASAESLDDILASNGALATSSAVPAKLSYDDGVRIEADNFDMKLNLHIQANAAYEDFEDASDRGLSDRTSFDVPRARIIFGGNLLGGEASYFLQADFVGDHEEGGDSSQLKDAWLRWNWNKDVGFQMGQFKVPFGRQELASDAKLEFVERSEASDVFTPSRDRGAMISGASGDIGYAIGAFNGGSDGENYVSEGVDTNLRGGAQVYWSNSDYGSRSMEGDYNNTDGTGLTAGLSTDYEQDTVDGVDYDAFLLGGDVGLRTGGFALQGELFWAWYDPDQDDSDSSNDLGYYVQAGYMVVPKEWEVAGRFSGVNPDSDGSVLGTDDSYEYAIAVNRYYNGHNLKLTLQATFDQEDGDENDTLDSRYEAQVNGYF